MRLLTRHRLAALGAVAVSLALLVLAALPLLDLRDSVSPMASVPTDTEVHRAWDATSAGFAKGVLSPTELVLYQPGLGARTRELSALQEEVSEQPGVAGVLGPAQGRLPLPERLADRFGLFFAPGGDAAAGLGQQQAQFAGDTALGVGLADSARSDYVRVATVVAAVDLVLLILFLRALIAPLYLIVCSVLVVGSALGLTSLLFSHYLGQDGVIFFVPFAVGALLASLGSDYNIFGVGDVWQAARTRPPHQALEIAVPRSTRAIAAAGITLAASFGFVALIPVAPFQELAVASAAGILIDTFLERQQLRLRRAVSSCQQGSTPTLPTAIPLPAG